MSAVFFHPFLPVLLWGIRPSCSAHVKVKAHVTCPTFSIRDASNPLDFCGNHKRVSVIYMIFGGIFFASSVSKTPGVLIPYNNISLP